MINTVNAVSFGLYAKKRHKFRSDFTYNKYHFGAFIQLFSALGIAATAKMPNPYVPTALFLAAIGTVSLPAYKEGFKEPT